jgi:hypothetical protein
MLHFRFELADSVDYVMYWWHKAAELVMSGKAQRFGMISTNSITQIFNRRTVISYLKSNSPISIVFAIPDHPWVNSGAAVRTAMTVGVKGETVGKLHQVQKNISNDESVQSIEFNMRIGKITPDLRIGADISATTPLKSNCKLTGQGMKLVGDFYADSELLNQLDLSINQLPIIKRYISPRNIIDGTEGRLVIDFINLSEEQARTICPAAYQHLLEKVKPFREQNKRKSLRELWWRFAWERPVLRESMIGLKRYFVTLETSKHRFFTAVDSDYLWDGSLFAIVSDDYFVMGVLSSQVHVDWALEAGGRMATGNTPRYNNSVCFDPFPFPDPTPEQKQKIRELGDRLDSHRKQVQAAHPEITITGMYNLLEKLRAGQEFTEADRAYNNKALVSTLKQIHDQLDQAVFAAYGWQDLWAAQQTGTDINETILERLVALNAERAAEERNGLIRWLRPEYQNPNQTTATQTEIIDSSEADETIVTPIEQQKWPTAAKAQLAAIRDLLRTSSSVWTVLQIANQFTGKNTQKKLDAIGENLDRLEWFGLLIHRQEADITYWQYADLQQTA